jgi:hypothetical protein
MKTLPPLALGVEVIPFVDGQPVESRTVVGALKTPVVVTVMTASDVLIKGNLVNILDLWKERNLFGRIKFLLCRSQSSSGPLSTM